MTQDELSKLINEFLPYPSKGQHYALREFAKLVAQHEREACIDIVAMFGGSIEIEAAIRARGQE